ncbi:MAG: aspartate carbamoyltransferase catalytic subunit [Holosporaceae bacterium]|nr:aspartate carbamoyltransferase catalytic subunit [Rhodospirillaceae bacterium]
MPAKIPPLPNLLDCADLTPQLVASLFDRAQHWLGSWGQPLADSATSKQPTARPRPLERPLAGLVQHNLFFENSTRTSVSFDQAGKLLGSSVSAVNMAASSLSKGESLYDTLMTLAAMRPQLVVIRHAASGAAAFAAQHLPDVAVINAGDGRHGHPTQALLDAFTIQQTKGALTNLSIAIVGDILHSRVARSNLYLLQMLGARVRLVAPPQLLPAGVEQLGASVHHDLASGLADVDVVMVLRMQEERMGGSFIASRADYFAGYGLTHQRLAVAKPAAIVMHPGPFLRDVDIASELADDPARSVILAQVEHGVAIRMAVLERCALSRGWIAP